MNNITRTITVVIVIPLLVVGCSSALMETKVSSPSTKIQRSLDKKEYKYAYISLLDLQSDSSSKAQQDYKKFVENYQRELEIGGAEVLRNHFKGNASSYETLESFAFGMESEIKKYEQIAPETGRNTVRKILEEEFTNSRNTYPFVYPADKVVVGMSSDEFYRVVQKPPVKSGNIRIPFTPPMNFTVNEYTFTLPKKYNVSGVQPIWVAFLEGKVVRTGFGNMKHAEYEVYQWYLSESLVAGRIKQAPAMRILYKKYKEAYGQSDPITHEYMTFLIMVSENIDSGSITQSEAEYKVAQKNAEIQSRLTLIKQTQEAIARDKARVRLAKQQLSAQMRAQRQSAQMQRNQMLLQGSLGMQYLNQMNQINQSLQGIKQNTAPGSHYNYAY